MDKHIRARIKLIQMAYPDLDREGVAGQVVAELQSASPLLDANKIKRSVYNEWDLIEAARMGGIPLPIAVQMAEKYPNLVYWPAPVIAAFILSEKQRSV